MLFANPVRPRLIDILVDLPEPSNTTLIEPFYEIYSGSGTRFL